MFGLDNVKESIASVRCLIEQVHSLCKVILTRSLNILTRLSNLSQQADLNMNKLNQLITDVADLKASVDALKVKVEGLISEDQLDPIISAVSDLKTEVDLMVAPPAAV